MGKKKQDVDMIIGKGHWSLLRDIEDLYDGNWPCSYLILPSFLGDLITSGQSG